jgi:hypothetical protein
MKGLLIKDLVNIGTQKRIIIILLFLIAAGVFIPDMSIAFSLGVLSMISVTLMLTLFSVDEQSNWDKYALTAGVSRKDLVMSKYVFAVGLTVINFIITLILGTLMGDFSFGISLLTAGLLASATLLILSVMIPLLYKFGVQKGKLMFLIPILLLAFAGRYLPDLPSVDHIDQYIKFVPIIAIALYLISAQISLFIVAKKEYN